MLLSTKILISYENFVSLLDVLLKVCNLPSHGVYKKVFGLRLKLELLFRFVTAFCHVFFFFFCLATASKTYIGSVLFRTSAYTGTKQASRVPFWLRDLSHQNHLVPGHLVPFFVRVISYHFSGHLVPSFIMGFNSLMLFFYVSKFAF